MSTTNVAPTAAQFVNRTYYTAGATYSGFKVLSTATTTTFSAIGLTASKTYYFWIVPYNDLCFGGPLYNLSNVLTGSATTCFLPTTAGAATLVGGNQFTANWSAVGAATNYIIDVSTNSTFTAMLPGYSGLSVANTITTLPITGLLPATTYYYRVRAMGPGCILYSATITVTTSCGYYTIPYTQNFETTTVPGIPACNSVQMVAGAPMVTVNNTTPFYGFNNKNLITSGNLAQNTWYFTQKINFPAAGSYKLSYKYGGSREQAFFTQKMKVYYGAAASDVGMTTLLADHNQIKLSPLNNVINFTVSTPGVYYIGFNGYAAASQGYLQLDDIVVDYTTCFPPTS
jgi:hypothetical protein